jgi:hypothetical protein
VTAGTARRDRSVALRQQQQRHAVGRECPSCLKGEARAVLSGVAILPTMVRRMPEIECGYLVTDVFGRWPSFHDAEVLRLRLDHQGEAGPWLEADIYTFEMTSEIDERGFYVLDKQHVVTLRFDGLVGLDLRWFSQQNVISTLAIEAASDDEEPSVRWHVDIGSSVGMEGEFNCASVRVVAVEPVAV